MTKYYHGTSLQSAKSIMKYGFQKGQNIWKCSNPLAVYFYRETVSGENLFEDAVQNAQITSALTGTQDTSVAVIIADIPDSYPVHPDYSADNMNTYAVEFDRSLLNEGIQMGDIKITMIELPDVYFPGARYFYLSTLDLELLETDRLSEMELNIIQSFSLGEFSELYDLLILETVSDAIEEADINNMKKAA